MIDPKIVETVDRILDEQVSEIYKEQPAHRTKRVEIP